MESISFFDDSYPVRTIYTDMEDYKKSNGGDIGYYCNYLNTADDLSLNDLKTAHESHSGNVLVIDDKDPDGRLGYIDETYSIKEPGGFDSMITSLPSIMLAVRTADCLPVFLYDTKREVIAIAHSGWRGTVSGIAVNTIRVMERCFDTRAEDVIAAFGPCICGSCYEVGHELTEFFAARFDENERNQFFTSGKEGKYYLDVKKAALIDLLRAGVEADHIYDTGICSYESPAYASYRRDGKMPLGKQTLSGIALRRRL